MPREGPVSRKTVPNILNVKFTRYVLMVSSFFLLDDVFYLIYVLQYIRVIIEHRVIFFLTRFEWSDMVPNNRPNSLFVKSMG